MKYRNDLHTLLEPAVKAAEAQLWGVEYLPSGKHSILRVYVDKPEGVTVDDCAIASRQISALLDVEDPITGAYSLEVSSPGIDRPLFLPEHFAQLVGQKVQLQLLVAEKSKRKIQGIIESVQDNSILLKYEDTQLTIAFSNINKANLVVDI
ncbi:MAG: ribosome maturation factor RimP [Gammaproteobacteria bacterium]|nr:ribosome maturation factor RimP [Gammaproteobacteria bacterium]